MRIATTAALAVLQGQLTDEEDLVSAVRYAQSLEKLQQCLTRHAEAARDVWHLDEHFRLSERVLQVLREKGADVERIKANLQAEARDPPILN
jgi:hypothetical protein